MAAAAAGRGGNQAAGGREGEDGRLVRGRRGGEDGEGGAGRERGESGALSMRTGMVLWLSQNALFVSCARPSDEGKSDSKYHSREHFPSFENEKGKRLFPSKRRTGIALWQSGNVLLWFHGFMVIREYPCPALSTKADPGPTPRNRSVLPSLPFRTLLFSPPENGRGEAMSDAGGAMLLQAGERGKRAGQ
jgi:hypothetical protein